MRHRILLAASFLYLTTANLIWIARDTRPPFWDMAAHQTAALRIQQALTFSGLMAFGEIPSLTGYYPPFYHSIVAIFYSVFGQSVDSAQWANLPAMLVLLLSTYGIGRTFLNPLPAAGAAILIVFYPFLQWLSRETLIDYWLTAMVALAMYLGIRSDEFSKPRWAVAFGIACGFGMLTKWTFPFFIAMPALWMARRCLRHAFLPAGLAAFIASYWYWGAGPRLAQFFSLNTAGGISEGDPSRLSIQAALFYVRALEGYQLFLPLFVAFLFGAVLLARNFDQNWTPILLWLIGGWLGLMLFQNKDPRSSAPLLPAVALITAQIFRRRESLVFALVPFLLFQHYLVSFGIRQLPETVVLARGVEGPLSWDWNLYTQTYFDLWGKPAREDWKIQHVLDKINPPDGRLIRLGLIPDIPRFDGLAFEFHIQLLKLPVAVQRVWKLDEHAIANNDYILLSETGQGWATQVSQDVQRINGYVLDHPEWFQVIDWFPLPNGDLIRLYKVGSL